MRGGLYAPRHVGQVLACVAPCANSQSTANPPGGWPAARRQGRRPINSSGTTVKVRPAVCPLGWGCTAAGAWYPHLAPLDAAARRTWISQLHCTVCCFLWLDAVYWPLVPLSTALPPRQPACCCQPPPLASQCAPNHVQETDPAYCTLPAISQSSPSNLTRSPGAYSHCPCLRSPHTPSATNPSAGKEAGTPLVPSTHTALTSAPPFLPPLHPGPRPTSTSRTSWWTTPSAAPTSRPLLRSRRPTAPRPAA